MKELLRKFAEFIAMHESEGNEDYDPSHIELIDGQYYWNCDKDGDQPIPENALVKWFMDENTELKLPETLPTDEDITNMFPFPENANAETMNNVLQQRMGATVLICKIRSQLQ